MRMIYPDAPGFGEGQQPDHQGNEPAGESGTQENGRPLGLKRRHGDLGEGLQNVGFEEMRVSQKPGEEEGAG